MTLASESASVATSTAKLFLARWKTTGEGLVVFQLDLVSRISS
jgi:hypothetical protein